jgi:hypothetical protein
MPCAGFRAPLNLPHHYEAGQSAVLEAANDFMAAGPVVVLQAAAGTAQVVDLVQRHFHAAVQPRLALVRRPCPAFSRLH